MLCKAIEEMERGLVDANLGGGVFKKRVALPGRGKSGGARALIATNRENRWIFVYGFEKNDSDNITQAELAMLKQIAKDLLECPEAALKAAIRGGELLEVQQ